jgi:hypothetical protein
LSEGRVARDSEQPSRTRDEGINKFSKRTQDAVDINSVGNVF